MFSQGQYVKITHYLQVQSAIGVGRDVFAWPVSVFAGAGFGVPCRRASWGWSGVAGVSQQRFIDEKSFRMKVSRTLPPILVLGCLVLFLNAVQASWAQSSPASPTSATLNVSSNQVPAGTAVTLTAAVVSGATPVTAGQVVFCNSNAVHCEDAAILGSAWLTKSGTATVHKLLGLGTHNVQAVFKGTNSYAASTSASVAVGVTGSPLPTTTTISAAGATGNYTLTATVTAGNIVSPTGSVSFLDASNGNYQLASAAMGMPSLAFSFAGTLGPVADSSNRVIALGDFNNDGYPDYVIATLGSSSTATIMTGNGDGTFTKGASYAVGAYPQGVVVADFQWRR